MTINELQELKEHFKQIVLIALEQDNKDSIFWYLYENGLIVDNIEYGKIFDMNEEIFND